MTKTELVERIAKQTGESKAYTQHMLDATIAQIERSLAKGEDVAITGFGRWSVQRRAARRGINPRTGEQIKIRASKSPRFAAGARLKRAVSKR